MVCLQSIYVARSTPADIASVAHSRQNFGLRPSSSLPYGKIPSGLFPNAPLLTNWEGGPAAKKLADVMGPTERVVALTQIVPGAVPSSMSSLEPRTSCPVPQATAARQGLALRPSCIAGRPGSPSSGLSLASPSQQRIRGGRRRPGLPQSENRTSTHPVRTLVLPDYDTSGAVSPLVSALPSPPAPSRCTSAMPPLSWFRKCTSDTLSSNLKLSRAWR